MAPKLRFFDLLQQILWATIGDTLVAVKISGILHVLFILQIYFQVAVTVSNGEAIRVIVGPPMLTESDPQMMSTAERLDFITW